MRLTIAAQACFLLLNRDAKFYPSLYTIIVYPASFAVKSTYYDGHVETVIKGANLGESWDRGPVVLSWDSSKHSGRDSKDGENVVFHEFAHQLDQEFWGHNGIPTFHNQSECDLWVNDIQAEFEAFQKAVNKQKETLINPNGAENLSEFFAYTTEVFFERPLKLKSLHPKVYERFVSFYKLNPLDWV